MSKVIHFEPGHSRREPPIHDALSPDHPPAQSQVSATQASPDLLTASKINRINELEMELLKIVDEITLRDQFKFNISEKESEDSPGSESPEMEDLDEIVVFSPEIQRDGVGGGSGGDEDRAPSCWGDVFVKAGEEYPFLFTLYTASYARGQLLRYGERILPSPKDIILNRDSLQGEDIVRAVIKWVNLYRPTLRGRPIRLESESVLQTLVCDPFVEIQCPDSTL